MKENEKNTITNSKVVWSSILTWGSILRVRFWARELTLHGGWAWRLLGTEVGLNIIFRTMKIVSFLRYFYEQIFATEEMIKHQGLEPFLVSHTLFQCVLMLFFSTQIYIGAIENRDRLIRPTRIRPTLNIAKGKTDPRVEYISQVQTQFLIKFYLQNLDQASTSKSQPNISIYIKLMIQNIDQT